MTTHPLHGRRFSTRGDFDDNPIVYHLITDRFFDGAAATDGAKNQAQCDPIGGFHGGNLKGVTAKLNEGWFSRLGVNAILISAPYQQILGWVPGANGEFKHYAYHGYYALDYTVLDPRFGTDDDLRELVTAAHRLGIRVLLDIVMNHPGYPDLETLQTLDIKVVKPGWQNATPADYYDYLDRDGAAFADWWGGEWVRCDVGDYPRGGDDDLTTMLSGLPDFCTESEEIVRLPQFLKGRAGTKAVDLPHSTVRGYLIAWLTQWVREYGIDGFRCDSAKHVELDAWFELKWAAKHALRDWQQAHHSTAGRHDFWMTGEVFGNGIEPNHYFDFGFDNLINFHFQHEIEDGGPLDAIYAKYAARLQGRPGYNVLSYISSHDTCLFNRNRLIDGISSLLLAPGGVLIFYGDETARLAGPFTPSDPTQATRSPMNWDAIDPAVLEHTCKLGQFRNRHIALARGEHVKIQAQPYVFGRIDQASDDRVVVTLDIHGTISIPVGPIFQDGEEIRDHYSGSTGRVRNGAVELGAMGTVLLERPTAFAESHSF